MDGQPVTSVELSDGVDPEFRFATMNVRSFVSSPLATVLQNICGRYLVVEGDPETLALELHRKQVTLRNVLLNTTAFNTELAAFGLELRRGHATRAELRVIDLATCRTSLELERVTIHLATALTAKNETMSEGNKDSGIMGFLPLGAIWKSAAPIAHTVWKWFTSNLGVKIQHLTLLLETQRNATLQMEMEDVQYQAATCTEDSCGKVEPRVTVGTVYLSLPHTSTEDQRILALKTVALMLGLSDTDRIESRLQIDRAELDVTSDVWHRVKRLLSLEDGDDSDFGDAMDTASSVYYDAMDLSRTSSVYSDVSDSAFFDCEDVPLEEEASPFRSIDFSAEVHQTEVMIRGTSDEGAQLAFLLDLKDVQCQGTHGDRRELEMRVGGMRFVDKSPGADPMTPCTTRSEIPQTLHSMMRSCEEQCAYWQFGFPQLRQKACLHLKIRKEGNAYLGSMESDPFTFWCSCASVQRALTLLSTFSFPVRRTEAKAPLPEVEFEWNLPGMYGVMERARNQDTAETGLLFLELKSVADGPLVTQRPSYDSHRLHGFIPTRLSVTSISIARLGLYHCLCRRGTIVGCRPVLSCTDRTVHRSGIADSARACGKALSVDIRNAIEQRHHASDLSNLAHHLVHTMAQTEEAGFQERRLNRVEFEGKCVHSADIVIELDLESAELDVDTHDMETVMDTVLHFWRPAKMADQMKLESSSQSVLLLNAEHVVLKVKEQEARHPLELEMEDTEICLVSGVQRKTISTFAVSVRTLKSVYVNDHPLCSVGGGGVLDLDEPGVEFFEVSELDYRNAKFKQWLAIRQKTLRLDIDRSVLSLRWMADAVSELLEKNKDRIQTDIEAENTISYVVHDSHASFRTVDATDAASTGDSLEVSIDRLHFTLQDLERLTAEVLDVTLNIGSTDGMIQKIFHEKHLQCSLRPKEEGTDVEIRNAWCSVEVDPDRLGRLIRIMHSVKSLFHREDVMEVDLREETSLNVLQGIADDTFAAKKDDTAAEKRSILSQIVEREEDEDGFIVIDDLIPKERGDRKESSAAWIDGGQLSIHEDYIHFPSPYGIMDASVLGHEQSSGTMPVAWNVRCLELSLVCSLFGLDPSEHVDFLGEGVHLHYAQFHPGVHYKNRWTVSVQECRIVYHRDSGEEKCVLERNRSQLRTECSKRLNQQQTLSAPMFRATLETVLPDAKEATKTTEMRVGLQVVPLRLRLSQSLTDFANLFMSSLPPSAGYASGGVYFQRSAVSALFVVVDYCPRKVDLDRLKRGRTSELINMVQWEGLEFFLNEIKVCGISGWENLLSHIVSSWTHDITHSEKHRLLGGFPALGVLKRVSPAAQDVVHAAICKVMRTEPAEQDIRGVAVSQSRSLSRALGEFGRVFSLEVLNLCANGAEGMHLVMDGTAVTPATSDTSSSLRRARSTLRRAAHSVITEPIQSVRSGEGIGVAMTKALWAAPRALLAPASAAVTVMHGALRSACDALDTERVLDS